MVDFTKLRTLSPEEVEALPKEQTDAEYIRRNTTEPEEITNQPERPSATQRTPKQIIGDDAYLQLISEGYEVKPMAHLRCEGCDQNFADPPSKLCPGCQAYRGHQA